MTPKEAMEFIEFLADTSRKWEEYDLQEELITTSIVKGKVSTALFFYIRAFIQKFGKLKSKMTQKTKLRPDTTKASNFETTYFPNRQYLKIHQGEKTCIHSNPLEQTLTKLHGMIGDFIVEQS